jgi:hypothetical protein
MSIGRRSTAGDRIAFGYFLLARVALATAGGLLLFAPPLDAGFYQPRVLALTHLMTLGWITSTILGVFYGPAPRFFGGRSANNVVDYVALGLFAPALAVFVASFLLSKPAWRPFSAAVVAAAGAWAVSRYLLALRRSRWDRASRWAITLGCWGWFLVSASGALLADNSPWLGSDPLLRAAGHAHLGALSFAATLVVGFGSRLMPMLLPSATPPASVVLAASSLLWTGGVAIAIAFWWGHGLMVAAMPALAGVVVLFAQLVWMVRRPRTPSALRAQREPGRWLLAMAFVSLGLAALVAMADLSGVFDDVASLRLAGVYVALLLVGFLGQLVAGLNGFIVPMWAWLCIQGGEVPDPAVPTPWRLEPRGVRRIAAVAWPLAVAALALHLGGIHQPFALAARFAGTCLLVVAACELFSFLSLWRSDRHDGGHAPAAAGSLGS